jgi:hypothetical protein
MSGASDINVLSPVISEGFRVCTAQLESLCDLLKREKESSIKKEIIERWKNKLMMIANSTVNFQQEVIIWINFIDLL